MAGIVVPTPEEVQEEFRTALLTVGRGRELPNYADFTALQTRHRWIENAWSNQDQERGVATLIVEEERILLLRAYRKWFIDRHRDGQWTRVRSEIQNIVNQIRNMVPDANTVDMHFEFSQQDQAGGTDVTCLVRGICRNYED